MTDPLWQPDPFRLCGTALDGRFQVVREVAEGGFGVVYKAIQVTLDRPVALKVLKTPPTMDDAAREHFHKKFAAEAKTIARIRHPNIVDVYDFGVSKMPSGTMAPWMALEWLNGNTLDDYLADRRGMGGQSPHDVLALMRPIFRAFAYTHRDGIAHRDIKPANIMIVANGSRGAITESGALLRILDFGIAKVMNSDESPGSGQTRTAGMPAFSPQYAAPEQMAYGRTGPWTDVHALGLIMTEMLVDESPYQESEMQLFEAAMSTRRPTPAMRGRNVGPWEPVLAKALALSPAERWKSAGEFLVALEETLEAAISATSATSAKPAGTRGHMPTPTAPPVRPHLPEPPKSPLPMNLQNQWKDVAARLRAGWTVFEDVLTKGVQRVGVTTLALAAVVIVTLCIWLVVWRIGSLQSEGNAPAVTQNPASRAVPAPAKATHSRDGKQMLVVPLLTPPIDDSTGAGRSTPSRAQRRPGSNPTTNP